VQGEGNGRKKVIGLSGNSVGNGLSNCVIRHVDRSNSRFEIESQDPEVRTASHAAAPFVLP